MARRFEQPRLASPRSMPLLAPDRLAVTNERSSTVMPPLARSGSGARYGPGVKVPRLHHGEAETEVAHGPLPRVDLAQRARK